ncbi:hypothetical protein LINPERHAP1_LOCUS14653, partial [Linum perenne]
MDYMFGEVPLGVRSGSPEDPSILWGDAERHRASGIFEAHTNVGDQPTHISQREVLLSFLTTMRL